MRIGAVASPFVFVGLVAAQAEFVDPAQIVPRVDARGAVDPDTGALYVVGGRADQILDAWRLHGGAWQRLPALPLPGPVSGLAYDPVRNRLVVAFSADAFTFPLWEFDGTNWAFAIALPGPNAELLWDPWRQKLLVWGPTTYSGSYCNLWAWNGSALAQQPMTGQPWPGIWGRIAFDAASGRVVVAKNNGISEWDGASWTTTAITWPLASYHLPATDPWTGRVVYHYQSGSLTSAVTWDGQALVPWSVAGMPPRYRPVFVGNGTREVMHLVGGIGDWPAVHADAWEYDGITWQQVQPNTGSPRFTMPRLAATGVGELLAFDGGDFGLLVRTARWQNGVWTELQPTTSPPPRSRFALAGDPATGRAFLFGGQAIGGALLGDFWLWNGSTWQQLPSGPAPRAGHGLCFRDDAQRVVLYGGDNNYETWEWDGSQWLLRSPNFPPHNGDASLCWHPIRKRVVLTTYGLNGIEVWEWNGSAWFSTNPPTRPQMMDTNQVRTAYDPVRERVLLVDAHQTFGMPGLQGRAYEWDGVGWSEFVPAWRLREGSMVLTAVPGVGAVVLNPRGQFLLTQQHAFPASATSFGGPCPDPQRLLTANQPWLGTTYTLRFPCAAGSQGVFAFGFSNTQAGGAPLPLGLGFVGLPTCDLLVSLDVLTVQSPIEGVASQPVVVPPTITLAGAELFHQAAALSPAFAGVTQGLHVVLGSLW